MVEVKRLNFNNREKIVILLKSQQKGMVPMIRLRVKEVADAKGLNMTKLSQRSEISFTTVKSMFRNPYKSINTETLDRLAKALNVSVFDLIEEVSEEQAEMEQEK